MIADLIPKLKGHIPDSILAQLPDVCKTFGIDGPLRLSHFLGQTKEETGGFTVFVENLHYKGAALWTLFHKHFENEAEANSFALQPERIANRIYSDRMGNGDEASGDGWKYRGRGALQTTGKDNYRALGAFLGIDLVANPDLVASDYIMASAGFFFMNGHIWTICDKGVDIPTITAVTKKVNGGTINLDVRIKYTQEIYNILKAA